MEYQKIIILLNNTTNQLSKFRTRKWIEINHESEGMYDNSNIRLKTSIISSNLCDYSHAYILFKATTTIPNTTAAGAAVNNINKKVIFKNCAPFTDCITDINNTQADDTETVDVVISMYNLIEHSDAYSKTTGSLWQYNKDEPTLENNGNIIDIPDDNNNSALFKFKQKIAGKTGNSDKKDVEIMVI